MRASPGSAAPAAAPGAVGGAEVPGVLYAERIGPPLWWALPAAGMVASVALALAVSLGPGAAALGALVTVALVAAGAGSLSRSRFEVHTDGLLVDRVLLPMDVLRGARALSAAESARVRGPDYDPRGWYRIRGWVPTAVLLTLADPLDPTPFWYVSSRRPELAVAAVARAVDAPAAPDAAAPDAVGEASAGEPTPGEPNPGGQGLGGQGSGGQGPDVAAATGDTD